MLKVGDVIKFRGDGKKAPQGYNARLDGIPSGFRYTNGTLDLKANRGVIIYVYQEWRIVEYTDIGNIKVRLGFKEEDLIPIENRIKNLRKELIRRQQNGI